MCVRRDVKGLHAKANAGRITGMTGMTGVDGPYGLPEAPRLRPRADRHRPRRVRGGSARPPSRGRPGPPVREGRGGSVRCGSRGCAAADGSPRRRP
ncbi:adenylyl-sulfate kinase [Streptomyces sp. NPDC004726]